MINIEDLMFIVSLTAIFVVAGGVLIYFQHKEMD
jgi:hypothetical protein